MGTTDGSNLLPWTTEFGAGSKVIGPSWSDAIYGLESGGTMS